MTKKIAVALAVASIASTATFAYAGLGAATGINGSLHDLNAVPGYGQDTFSRSCVFCHTPHNAKESLGGYAPLWNHKDTQVSLAAYQWQAPTNKGITISDPLIGPSRLCMACHDGSTAVDGHGSAGLQAGNPNGMQSVDSSHYPDTVLGGNATRYITNLNTTHPIGFLYDQAFEKRGPSELVSKDTGFIKNTPPISGWDTNNRDQMNLQYTQKKIKDTLYGALDQNGRGGYMTCASCHDVHNTVNAKPDGDNPLKYNYFLYAKEEGSAICLSCHVK